MTASNIEEKKLKGTRVNPIAVLVNELSKLPGIGEKSASRLAFHIIRGKRIDAEKLSNSILEAHNNIKMCANCHNFTQEDICSICSDVRRNQHEICVVEDPSDLWAIERTAQYRGLYHVLHGLISPLAGVGPDDLKLKSLLERVNGLNEDVEVILATNPTVEGEATSMYINKLLKHLSVKITKIAYGLPIGSSLEYIDKLTLSRALEDRRDF